MSEYLKMYITTLIVFLVIDSIWLGYVARDLYQKHIGFIMKKNFNLTAAGLFYLVFVIGLVYFVINPATSWQQALYAGLFFGFITYSTYDMTNLATLEDWPLVLTIIDISWGTFLCGLTSLVSYVILHVFM
ncbi:MAG: DUF2177 family protein [Halanaerobiaceae bacterium]